MYPPARKMVLNQPLGTDYNLSLRMGLPVIHHLFVFQLMIIHAMKNFVRCIMVCGGPWIRQDRLAAAAHRVHAVQH